MLNQASMAQWGNFGLGGLVIFAMFVSFYYLFRYFILKMMDKHDEERRQLIEQHKAERQELAAQHKIERQELVACVNRVSDQHVELVRETNSTLNKFTLLMEQMANRVRHTDLENLQLKAKRGTYGEN